MKTIGVISAAVIAIGLPIVVKYWRKKNKPCQVCNMRKDHIEGCSNV